MTVHARFTYPILGGSIQKWLFGSSSDPLPRIAQFIDPEKSDTHFLTIADYRLWSKRVAMGLLDAGLQPGDRVMLFSCNHLFFPVVFMGIIMAGGIFTGANPGYVVRELAYQLKDSDTSFLIAGETVMEKALEAASEVGLSRDRIFSFDDTAMDQAPGKALPGTRHWTELLASPESAEKWDWVEPTDPAETLCCLNYSSGTTGLPKGVEITHSAYVAGSESFISTTQRNTGFESWRSQTRHLCFLPLYHAYGQAFFCTIFPKFGTPVYIMKSFDFVKTLEHVQKYRITMLFCVPTILSALAKHPITRKYDLSSIQNLGSGGAALSADIAREVIKLWPTRDNHFLQQGWGMTELVGMAIGHYPLDKTSKPDLECVGELAANMRARLMRIDGSGREVTVAKEHGELWITGPTVMKGYWHRPEATADMIHIDSDGTRWLKTGDVAYIDPYEPRGKWYFVDRIKELIKVKGHQVAPAELEGVLLQHEAIVDACVVGVTIESEEVPRAYVVLKPQASTKKSYDRPSEHAVALWMQSRVSRHKRLEGGVKFIDAIPRTESGKLLRNILRDQAAQEVREKLFRTSPNTRL